MTTWVQGSNVNYSVFTKGKNSRIQKKTTDHGICLQCVYVCVYVKNEIPLKLIIFTKDNKNSVNK